MKTLYVRINPKLGTACFYRCGIEFSQAWRPLIDVDDATAQRLEEEQMLEVTETRPAELDDVLAGDSAEPLMPAAAVTVPVPPADAPEVAAPEVVAAEVAAPEAAAEAAAPAKTAKKAK